MNILENMTITDVTGILALGIACGIKNDGKKDLCVIYSKYKTNAAAAFTKNKVKGAPVILNTENIKGDNIQAIVINSGNANSCTGEQGIKNAYKMCESTAKALKLLPKEILVASTGALGIQLPMELLIPGIEKACSMLEQGNGKDAAEAILSTDTTSKTIAVEFEIEGKKVSMAGMAKGSTMIHPNMGTLLAFVVTDGNIAKPMLDKALKESVAMSFNMISVDGDTSTNDMAVVLANGASGHTIITEEGENYKSFLEALCFVNTELAKKIAKDGEGSSKLLEVNVHNAKTMEDARKCAKAVVSSNLVKCGLFGRVANWPDIICALGYSGADFNPDSINMNISNGTEELQLVKEGCGTGFCKDAAEQLLSKDNIKITIDLRGGIYSAAAWGCDLTYDYVKTNAYMGN
jgi:glutamate N-acetyltransferase / amino-acid N-acetyltransferase